MLVFFCFVFCGDVFFFFFFFFFQAEDGIRDHCVTGVQTCALPIYPAIRCSSVLFPEPLAPMTARNWPSRTVRLIPQSAATRRSPCRNSLVTFSTTSGCMNRQLYREAS